MRIKTVHYVSIDDNVNEKVTYGDYVVIPRLGEHVQYYVRNRDKVKLKVYVVTDVVYDWHFQKVQIILKDWTQ